MEKVFEFYFGLKYQKMTFTEGGARLRMPLCSSKCALLRPKSVLLFLELPFYFPELSFFSRNSPVVFQKCPFLQNCPLIFHKCLPFIYCARLFPRILFFGWFFFLLVVLIAPQTDNICFALVSFFLELFIDQLMMLAFCLCSHSSNNRLPVPGDLCVPNFLYVNSPCWYMFRQGDHIFLKT